MREHNLLASLYRIMNQTVLGLDAEESDGDPQKRKSDHDKHFIELDSEEEKDEKRSFERSIN